MVDPAKVRDALRSLPESALFMYLGANGFADIKRFLVIIIIDGARWDEVPIRQSEWMSASRPDCSTILERAGGDLL